MNKKFSTAQKHLFVSGDWRKLWCLKVSEIDKAIFRAQGYWALHKVDQVMNQTIKYLGIVQLRTPLITTIVTERKTIEHYSNNFETIRLGCVTNMRLMKSPKTVCGSPSHLNVSFALLSDYLSTRLRYPQPSQLR